MDQTPSSKLVDPSGNPIPTAKPAALATQPIRIDAGRLDLLDPELPDEGMVRQLEQRAIFRERIIQLALRQTAPSQYVIHRAEGDEARESVYPMGAAADAMFGFLGLTWAVAVEIKDSTGQPLTYRRGDVKWESDVRKVPVKNAGGEIVREDEYYWVRSGLWSRDALVALAEGKRLIGAGYAKDAPTAELSAFENLKSRAVREVLGLKGKDRVWYKAQGLDLTAARVAEFQDHKRATSADPQQAVLPFGREKGTKVCDASDEGLNWILPKVRESVADPKKVTYKTRNEALATAIETELAKRAAKPTVDAAQAEEFEKTIIAVREEAIAMSADPVKLESYLAGLKTLDQAKKALEYYQGQRQKREAKRGAA